MSLTISKGMRFRPKPEFKDTPRGTDELWTVVRPEPWSQWLLTCPQAPGPLKFTAEDIEHNLDPVCCGDLNKCMSPGTERVELVDRRAHVAVAMGKSAARATVPSCVTHLVAFRKTAEESPEWTVATEEDQI